MRRHRAALDIGQPQGPSLLTRRHSAGPPLPTSDTNYSPSLYTRRRFPVWLSQRTTAPSSPADVNSVPCGSAARHRTALVCPFISCKSLPSSGFHRRTVPSSEPVAMRLPSEVKTTHVMPREREVQRFLPVAASHVYSV